MSASDRIDAFARQNPSCSEVYVAPDIYKELWDEKRPAYPFRNDPYYGVPVYACGPSHTVVVRRAKHAPPGMMYAYPPHQSPPLHPEWHPNMREIL